MVIGMKGRSSETSIFGFSDDLFVWLIGVPIFSYIRTNSVSGKAYDVDSLCFAVNSDAAFWLV